MAKKADWHGMSDSRPCADPKKNAKDAPYDRDLGGGSGGVDWTGMPDSRPSSTPGPNKKA